MINFTEIFYKGLEQDRFEEFAADFLNLKGFQIIGRPSRGADDGVDLLIEEKVVGIVSDFSIKWLVSVKHYAHSGKAVGNNDETDIYDRVRMHNANGFMTFYSTLLTSSLRRKLANLREHFNVCIFDRSNIAFTLLNDNKFSNLFKQYFPKSAGILANNKSTYKLEFITAGVKHTISSSFFSDTHNLNHYYITHQYDTNAPKLLCEIPGHSLELHAQDLDADGIKELIITYRSGIHTVNIMIFKLNRSGFELIPGSEISSDWPTLEWKDLDCDGVYEIYVKNRNNGSTENTEFSEECYVFDGGTYKIIQ